MAEAENTGNKRQSVKKVDSAKLAQGIYEATFADGEVVTCGLGDIPEEFRAAMTDRFTQYGLKQKLDDAMAGAETVEEAREELKSTWESITKGAWTSRVAGDGVEGGLFARAYSEFHGISLSDAKAKIGSLVDKNLKANQEANKDKKDAPEITDRMVFNKIRDAALTRYPGLKEKYEALKAKRSKKVKKGTEISIDLSEE